jgi:hypothetical protein
MGNDEIKTTVFCAVWSGDPNRKRLVRDHLYNLREQTIPVNVIYVWDNRPSTGRFKIVDSVKHISVKDPITIYEAWDIAIREAKTPYVMNLNLDDRLHYNAIAELESVLDRGDDLVGGDWDVRYTQDETDDVTSCYPNDDIPFLPEWPPADRTRLGAASERGTYGPAVMWRRSLTLGYITRFGDSTPMRSIADSIFWHHCQQKGARMIKIPYIIGNYHSHPKDQAEFRYPGGEEWVKVKKVGYLHPEGEYGQRCLA